MTWRAERRTWALALALLGCSSEPAITLRQAAAPTSPVSCEVDDDCDDGLVCSGFERCLDGRCWSGRPPLCNDGERCTRDLCLEPRGCAFVPICEDAGASASRLDAASTPSLEDAGADSASDASYTPRKPAYCSPELTVGGKVLVSSQAALEMLRGVVCIDGDVSISGLDLSSLTPLRTLRWVGGQFSIVQAPGLTSLAGVEALEYVEGSFELNALRGAEFAAGFDKLSVVEGNLTLGGWSVLQRLSGFAALTRVGGELKIEQPSLEQLDSAFGALESVAGRLYVSSAKLTTLDAFHALRSIGADLELPAALQALRGFGRLESLRGKLKLPAALLRFDAFAALQTIGELEIGSPQLSVLDGFRALRRASTLTLTGPLLARVQAFDALEEVTLLRLASLPVLRQVAGLGKLARVVALDINDTQLESLPFSGLKECSRLGLVGNLRLRDAEALRNVTGLTQLQLHGNPELRALPPMRTAPLMTELKLRENLNLEQVPLSGFEEINGSVTIVANPKLSSCQANILADKMRVNEYNRKEVACNEGCARCAPGGCAEPGDIDDNQSATVNTIGADTRDLRAYSAASSVKSLHLTEYKGPFAPLPNLKRVQYDVRLGGSVWKELSALSSLQVIEGSLIIVGASELTSLSGLSALHSVLGKLQIERCTKLADVTLPSLLLLPGGGRLWSNPGVPWCQVEQLRRQVSAPDAGVGSIGIDVMPCAGQCVGALCQ